MILVISSLTKAEDALRALQESTNQPVEICGSIEHAISLLQSRQFSAVVLDQVLLDSEPDEGEAVFKNLGIAVPVFVNFAVTSAQRLSREVRVALSRRERDLTAARQSAQQALRHELNDSVTVLLLSCQTARAEDLSDAASTKLQEIEAVARKLGRQITGSP